MLYNKRKREELRNSLVFKMTNKIWNDCRLNNTNNIGCLMFLIKDGECNTFEEWEKHYFASGELRSKLLQSKSNNINTKKLNCEYGRTHDELLEISKILQANTNLDLKTAYNFVYIRVIDETWIGYDRELKAFQDIERYLSKNYNSIYSIKNVDYYTDVHYAIDFEIYKDNKLIVGIQLKSVYYKKDSSSILAETKSFNNIKNEKYYKLFKVPVMYLYTKDGNIVNLEELDFLL